MPALRPAYLALAVALLSGCGDPSTVEGRVSTPTSSVSPSAATSAAPTSTLPAGVDQVVTVTVRDGKVVGGARRVHVERRSVVRLVVSSDVADQVHLHTYDKKVDVKAGGTATLTFTASIPGVFTVELESRHLTLVRLQVQ